MRRHFRKAAALLAAVSLIGFGSCERHKPSELHHGEPGADAAGHSAHEAMPHAEHASPHASATPAQFFPSPTP